MLVILTIAVWITFTIFAFVNSHIGLASALLILGVIDLVLVFFFGLGVFGVVFLAVLAIIGIIRFKLDMV